MLLSIITSFHKKHAFPMRIRLFITSLQPALEHVRRDGHHPVEDAGHAAREDGAGDAELGSVAALGGERALDHLVAAEVGGAGRDI